MLVLGGGGVAGVVKLKLRRSCSLFRKSVFLLPDLNSGGRFYDLYLLLVIRCNDKGGRRRGVVLVLLVYGWQVIGGKWF